MTFGESIIDASMFQTYIDTLEYNTKENNVELIEGCLTEMLQYMKVDAEMGNLFENSVDTLKQIVVTLLNSRSVLSRTYLIERLLEFLEIWFACWEYTAKDECFVFYDQVAPDIDVYVYGLCGIDEIVEKMKSNL